MRIEFEIIAPDGTLHHTGSFHQYAPEERRAFAERIASCQANGYEVRTWLAGARPQYRPHGVPLNSWDDIIANKGRPTRIRYGMGWAPGTLSSILSRPADKTRRRYRTALVIGWLVVAGLAVYAIPNRIHEIVTAHAAQ